MNKDILNTENSLIKSSSKKDEIEKIVNDITHNLNLINNLISHIREYNKELTETIKNSNLHFISYWAYAPANPLIKLFEPVLYIDTILFSLFYL